MIVIGAGGFAKELLEILMSEKHGYTAKNLFFFDNINPNISDKLYYEFRILKSFEEVREVFKTISKDYCIGIGNPKLRKKLNSDFKDLGGTLSAIISSKSQIGSFDINIKKGTCIMNGANISNSVNIGEGCLIYGNSFIAHDVIIGNYVEIGPGVNITGNCKIGDLTSIGAGTTIIPNITIGENVIIGAGSVIINDVPDNSKFVGASGRFLL